MAANNLRILLLNYEFPPLGGGAATASAQIARQMARRGAKVVVLTSHFRGLPKREEKDGYRIYRVAAMRRNLDRCSLPEMGGFIAGAALPALRLASQFKPNLMHVFFGMPTGPVGYLVSKLTGIPYLLSLRGGDVPGFMGEELRRVHNMTMPITRRVWSRASAIIANSQGLHELAQKTLPGKRIEIVPNGIDLDTFYPSDRTGDDLKKVRLLFVGRLAGQKGLPYLLQALAKLGPEVLNSTELELVGSGPDEGALRAMTGELRLNNVVKFLGWVPREEIPDHYRAADVFVLPSLDEGLPNVVLEAMGCGNALVATDIRGNQELVSNGGNGLLVPAADSNSLAEALGKVITDRELRERMGRISRMKVMSYSWASTADRYVEISNSIVALHYGHGRDMNSSERASRTEPYTGGSQH